MIWSSLISGTDGTASMAKVMAWLTLCWALVSWFYFPDRAIHEIWLILSSQFGYMGHEKWLRHKHAGQKEPDKEVQ